MKKTINRPTLAAVLAVSPLIFPTGVFAEDAAATAPEPSKAAAPAAPAENNPAVDKQKLVAEKSQMVAYEAREALFGTRQALVALHKKDGKSATSILQDVSKKLDAALKANPDMALLTADIDTEVVDFKGDQKTVKDLLKQISKDFNSGKLPNARQELDELASELRFTTVNIPLGTYPAAIAKATSLIGENKLDEAAGQLTGVLDSLVIKTEIIPLPVLRAENLLDGAAILEHREDLAKEKSRTEILENLTAAKSELKMAELLGYGDKQDFKPLYSAIDALNKVVHTAKSEAEWSKVKQSIQGLKNKAIPPAK